MNKPMKKSVCERQSSTMKKQPIKAVKYLPNNNTLVLWEMPLINSIQTINVSDAIFHYEMVVRGEQQKGPNNTKLFKSVSKIKFCVKNFMYKGKMYDFFMNPVDSICRCRQIPDIVINWKETVFSIPVLTKIELNKNEQVCKHLTMLERLIEEEFIPEIISYFKRHTL